jgi:putative nucleotidyltransferase with HDIG domain
MQSDRRPGHERLEGATAPPRRLRRDAWRLWAKVGGLAAAYAAASMLACAPWSHLASGPRRPLVAEAGFQLLSTATLVILLYRLMRRHLAAPVGQAGALLQLLSELTDAREHAVFGHSERVGAISRALAAALGLPDEQVERIAYAGLLHDIGKVGVPDHVLRKPGVLDDEERRVMMSHAELGAGIVGHAGPLAQLAPFIRHHHEWWDGGGYPDGLAGEAIPLGACIVAVADAFDTMTTGRPYRPALSLEEALGELERRAGTQFHPRVVAAVRTALPETAGVPGAPSRWPAQLVTLAEQEAARRTRSAEIGVLGAAHPGL